MTNTDAQFSRGIAWWDAFSVIVLFFAALHVFQDRFDPKTIYTLPPVETVVNFACGNGLNVDAFSPADPEFGNDAMKQFIERKARCFSCADSSQLFYPADSHPLFNNHRNIYFSMGVWWKAFGVCWDNLSGYFFIFFCVSILACYTLFRQVSGTAISLFSALGLVFSPLAVQFLPDVRAYAKFPLFVVFLVCVAMIIKYRAKARSLYYCFASGVIVGTGLGFRSDMILGALLFYTVAAVLWLFRLDCIVKRFLPAVLIFSCTVWLLAWNIIPTQITSSHSAHSFLLGLSPEKFEELGMQGLRCTVPTSNNDASILRLVDAYKAQIAGIDTSHDAYLDKEYDYYSSMIFSAYLHVFPAAILERTLIVAKNNLNILLDRGIFSFVPVRGGGWIIPVLACLCLSGALLNDWRSGLAVAACAGALLTVSSLQWELRHYFYLEFAGYFFICTATGWLVRVIASARVLNSLVPIASRLTAMGVAIVCGGVLCVALISFASVVQNKSLAQLLTAYADTPKKDVAYTLKPGTGNDITLTLDLPAEIQALPIRFLELRMSTPAKGGTDVVAYLATVFYPNPTLTLKASCPVSPGEPEFSIFIPVFKDESSIVLNRAAAAGLKSVRVMTDIRSLQAICTAVAKPDAL